MGKEHKEPVTKNTADNSPTLQFTSPVKEHTGALQEMEHIGMRNYSSTEGSSSNINLFRVC